MLEIPTRSIRLKINCQLTGYSKSHLLVFRDAGKTQQEWLWLKLAVKGLGQTCASFPNSNPETNTCWTL